MTRSDLIGLLAAKFPRLQVKDADLSVRVILDALSAVLSKGGRAEIRGFGSFVLNYKPPRIGRNPKTGAAVKVPEKYVPHFKAGKELRERADINEYRIDGFNIVDSNNPSTKIHIREILDSESAEFKRSKLTNKQKLSVISIVGLKPLTAMLDEYYRGTNKTYNAAEEAQCAYTILSNS